MLVMMKWMVISAMRINSKIVQDIKAGRSRRMDKEIEELEKDLIDIKNEPNDELGSYFPYTIKKLAEHLLKKGYRKPSGKVIDIEALRLIKELEDIKI